MFVTTNGKCSFDFDLHVLVELLGVIDKQIERIEVEVSRSHDADGFGCYDRMEGIVGLGFVACQQYINATYAQLAKPSEKRWEVVGSPPTHRCGKSFAQIADAAANLWKHRDEWPSQAKNARERRTRDVVDALTPSTDVYVLCNLLYKVSLPEPPRFLPILDALERWRDLRIH